MDLTRHGRAVEQLRCRAGGYPRDVGQPDVQALPEAHHPLDRRRGASHEAAHHRRTGDAAGAVTARAEPGEGRRLVPPP